jgi:hypothetical protein
MRNGLLGVLLVAMTAFSLQTVAFAKSPFKNFKSLAKETGFSALYKEVGKLNRKAKLAIIDVGFDGYEKELGKSLPSDIVFHPPIQDQNAGSDTETHGLFVAQVAYAFLSNDGEDDRLVPQIHLMGGKGYTNFKNAIDQAIEEKVDVILYASDWEYGNNFDGKGFINKIISKATDKGILFVKSAGNYALTTFNGSIETGDEDWVELPGKNKALEMKCETSVKDEKCSLRVVLSWNDYKDDIEAGTLKDLDLIVTDDTLNIIGKSVLTQTLSPTIGMGETKFPREIVEISVPKGSYFIRVKDRSKNFSSSDKLRVMIAGQGAVLLKTDVATSMTNPADHPDVITVGAFDFERSSLSLGTGKPEIFTTSLIEMSDTEIIKGSTPSAAIVAAAAVVARSLNKDITKKSFLAKASVVRPRHGLIESELWFTSVTQGCYPPVKKDDVSEEKHVKDFLKRGGVMVQTSVGPKIFTTYDPIIVSDIPGRRRADDMIVLTPNGLVLRHGSVQLRMSKEVYEVVQVPFQKFICGDPVSKAISEATDVESMRILKASDLIN